MADVPNFDENVEKQASVVQPAGIDASQYQGGADLRLANGDATLNVPNLTFAKYESGTYNPLTFDNQIQAGNAVYADLGKFGAGTLDSTHPTAVAAARHIESNDHAAVQIQARLDAIQKSLKTYV